MANVELKSQGPVLPGLILDHAACAPRALAMSFEERSWTYSDLAVAMQGIAGALVTAGIKPGDRLGYVGRNGAEFVQLWLGATLAKAVVVPINWRLSPREMIDILVDAKPSALFLGPEYSDLEESARAEIDKLRLVVLHETSGPRGFESWLSSAPADIVGELPSADEIAVQLYTSGTTGRAKGVLLSHDSLLYQRRASQICGAACDSQDLHDVLLVSLTVSHIGGLATLVRAFFGGGHAVILKEFETDRVLDAITQFGVTRLTVVPSTLRLLLRSPSLARSNMSSVEIMQYGASPIPSDLLQEALGVFDCGFVQVYGMTESGGAVTALSPEDHLVTYDPRMRSVGKPLPGVAIRVTHGEDRPLAVNEIGEIQVKTPAVMSGYWGLNAETGKAISPDGFLRTGDAGFVDADGYLHLCDRIKDMIVTGGENVYPAEVENVLHSHPDIADAAVIGVPDERWGEAVKAIVVREAGRDPTREELVEYMKPRIGRFKIPKSIDFASELPRNAAGKVLRRVLAEPYWAGHERRIS